MKYVQLIGASEMDFIEYIENNMQDDFNKNNFWWTDLINFYAQFYIKYKNNNNKFLTLKDFKEIIKMPYFPIQKTDKGGNNVIQILLYQKYVANRCSIMFFDNEIEELMQIIPNSTQNNNYGNSFFDHLNSFSFTMLDCENKLDAIIKKYQVDIFHVNTDGLNFLDKSLRDASEDRVKFYSKKGLKISGTFEHLLLTPRLPPNHETTKIFNEQLDKHNPFTSLIKINTDDSLAKSLIEHWIEFKKFDNIFYIIDYYIKKETKKEIYQDCLNCLQELKHHEVNQKGIQERQIVLETKILSNVVKDRKNKNNSKIPKI